MTIRVLLADDHPLMRAAFQMTLRAEADIDVVGEAADGAEAVERSRLLHPDIVLMDIRMPNMDGVEATRQLATDEGSPKVLILTTFDTDEYVVEALRAGASGFLLKDVRPTELVHAIRVVARGDALLAPSVTRRLLETFSSLAPAASGNPELLHALTDREIEVLGLVGRGLANDEIARELYVAESTVRTHLHHILDKLRLRDRIGAVVFAYDVGLVQPNRPLAGPTP
jgi:DNA-binding NarL/FixJ family response regulator